MAATVRWFEIYVDNMERAKTFYQTLFRVELRRLNNPALDIWAFPAAGGGGEMCTDGISGALVKMDGFSAGRNSVLVYFGSEDCAKEAAEVERCGGRIHKQKFSIGEYGFIALAYDTEGNMFGIHSLK